MKISLIVVPPGGGKNEYTLEFDLPAVPRANEYITVARDDVTASPERSESGELCIYECFFVRRAWWDLRYPRSAPYAKEGDIGSADMIAVEVEPAYGPHMTEAHRRSCEVYEAKGLKVRTFDDSGY